MTPEELRIDILKLAAQQATDDELGELIQRLAEGNDILNKKNKSLQARIDALMIEYCPEEMTTSQRDEWERNQKPHSPEYEQKAPARS